MNLDQSGHELGVMAIDALNSTSKLLSGKTLEDYANGVINTTYIPNGTPTQSDLVNDLFRQSNATYSGVDCTAVVIYNESVIILGNVETFSYSTFREKNPVRTLGRVYTKRYVAGSRTIAGTMIFIQFEDHPLYPLFKFFNERADNTHRYTTPLPDDVPPVDIMLIFNNEYGASSMLKLYGVEFFQEGGTFSINDLYSENTIQWVARDIDPMISAGEADSFKRLVFVKMCQGKTLDPKYASILQYRQTVANRVISLSNEIQQEHKDSTHTLGPFVGGIVTQFDTKGRDERIRQRNDIAAKEKLLKTLREELANIDSQISGYEQNNMSQDLNSGIESIN